MSGGATGVQPEVDARLAANDVYGARQLLEQHLAGLSADATTGEWRDALEAVVRLADRWEDVALADAARRAGTDPADVAALYALGHRLVDLNVTSMAVPVLARAVHAGPSSATVAELVAALELQGRYEESVAAIEGSGLAGHDPLCSYLLAFGRAMLGDLEPARDRLPGLQALGAEPFTTMAATLAGMLHRADALGDRLAPDDLRAWHLVWTGGVLLAPGPATPASGLAEWSSLRRSLDALVASLDRLHLGVDCVLAPPDRGSQILGLAAAALLELPVRTWRGEADPGVLVVHDELDVDRILHAALRTRPPGQVLYVQVADATREGPAAGELTGHYGAGLRPPWLGGIDADGELVEPDVGSAEQLLPRLLDAEPGVTADAGADAFVELVASTGLLAAAVDQGGRRSRQWVLPPRFRTA